ncbi:MAG TPA: MarR family transcriptional regulator [Candidatus Dormibacteraeota bacterium]|nr:MarR family transcriptional regulator [Candidatus Dormibacteraeota bacterium]
MKDPILKDVRFELARDEQGRLYNAGMRKLIGNVPIDLAAVEALGALRMAGKEVHHLQERWAEMHGLTEGRLTVMFRLFRCGPTPLGDLAEDLATTPRNITGLVDNLERDGLVERVPDPNDRRSVRATLTEAGKTRIKAIWKEGMERQYEIIPKEMTKEDLAQLRHLCLLLVENARKELGK